MSLGHIIPVAARDGRRARPLDHYRCSGHHAEWIARHFGLCRSIYNHSANQAGKTALAAAIASAMARGRASLRAFDGSDIALPTPPQQIAIGIGTPSYKLGEGSILDYIRGFLGDGEIREGRTSAGTSTFHVEHRLSRAGDYRREWSVIYVFPYEGPDPEEVRLDAWFADGPPTERWLAAIRNRGKAGRGLHGLITATPAKANEWEPIRAQYPERKREIDARGRATVQSSVYDNRFLHRSGCPGHDAGVGFCSCKCPDILRQEQENEGLADAKARLWGEHVNIRGGCPYETWILDRWEGLCVPPRETVRFVVQGERASPTGLTAVSLLCDLQVWEEDDPTDEYIVLVDPARGIDDGRHDPDGLHVRSRRTRALVARASQFLGAWGLGAAAVEVARAYRDADVYVARGGGYGDAALSALRVLGYYNVGRDRRTGRTAQQLGISETGTSRHEAMNAVAGMLQRGETRIPSRDVIQCFRHLVVDGDGKIEAGHKYHDEDLILIGHGERLLDLLGPLPELVEPTNTARDAFNKAFRQDFGFFPDRVASEGLGGVPFDSGRW